MIVESLRQYQLHAAQQIVRRKGMLLADQPGLGKTYEALGALELAGAFRTPGAVAVVAAPLMVCHSGWLATARRELDPKHVNVIDAVTGSRERRNGRIASQLDPDRANLIITNHDSIGISKLGKPHLPALHSVEKLWAIVIDESQYVLPMDYDYPEQATQFWRGLFALQEHTPVNAIRLAISGTPDRGKLHYRFGTWRFIMPHAFAPERVTWKSWLKSHFHTWTVRVPVQGRGGRTFETEVLKVGQLKNPDIWRMWDQQFVVRRTKAEVAAELPAKQYIDVDLALPAGLLGKYLDFQEQFLVHDDGSVKSAAVFALRAQQWATCTWQYEGPELWPVEDPIVSSKVDWILEWLRERGYLQDGYDASLGKVVITSQFTRVLKLVAIALERAGVPAQILQGSTSAPQRQQIQQQFQDPASDLRVVLLSAGLGVGIDLDAADDLIFVDLPRDPDVQEQIEDRIHRVSRMHQVTIWRLRSAGTIDMLIQGKNDEVYQRTRALMDGSRGVDFARKVLARL